MGKLAGISGVITLATSALLGPTSAQGQASERLCRDALAPELAGMRVHRHMTNAFNNLNATVVDSGFAQSGQGKDCKLSLTREPGGAIEVPCGGNARVNCDLKAGQGPESHSFWVGNVMQRGNVQWVGNETLPVKVKRGDSVTEEGRRVEVIKFSGKWLSGSYDGDSVATLYYDRQWGLLLKATGAHDANQWTDAVTMVEAVK